MKLHLSLLDEDEDEDDEKNESEDGEQEQEGTLGRKKLCLRFLVEKLFFPKNSR